MKNLIIILIIALGLTSCGSIKKNYLKNNCKQDTVIFETIIYDTIEIPGAKADTSFTIPNCDSNTTDSVTVVNGKVSATMVRKGNKFKLSANYKGDSLIYSKPIRILVPCNCPPCPEAPKPTIWQNIKSYLLTGFAFIGLLAALAYLLKYLIAKLK